MPGVRRRRGVVRPPPPPWRTAGGREPGLGEWDVRSLVGHTSRALLTVETYLASPAEVVKVGSTRGLLPPRPGPPPRARTSRTAAGRPVSSARTRPLPSRRSRPAWSPWWLRAREPRWSPRSPAGCAWRTTCQPEPSSSSCTPRTSQPPSVWRPSRLRSPPRRHSTWSRSSPSPTVVPRRSLRAATGRETSAGLLGAVTHRPRSSPLTSVFAGNGDGCSRACRGAGDVVPRAELEEQGPVDVDVPLAHPLRAEPRGAAADRPRGRFVDPADGRRPSRPRRRR